VVSDLLAEPADRFPGLDIERRVLEADPDAHPPRTLQKLPRRARREEPAVLVDEPGDGLDSALRLRVIRLQHRVRDVGTVLQDGRDVEVALPVGAERLRQIGALFHPPSLHGRGEHHLRARLDEEGELRLGGDAVGVRIGRREEGVRDGDAGPAASLVQRLLVEEIEDHLDRRLVQDEIARKLLAVASEQIGEVVAGRVEEVSRVRLPEFEQPLEELHRVRRRRAAHRPVRVARPGRGTEHGVGGDRDADAGIAEAAGSRERAGMSRHGEEDGRARRRGDADRPGMKLNYGSRQHHESLAG